MKKIAIAAAMMCGFAVSAKTIYVRCGLNDYTGHNGTTWALAYETIQDGINASSSGDTVLVHAGDYDKGWGRGTPAAGASYHWWGKSRIFIRGGEKNLTIRSCRSEAEEDVLDPEHTVIWGESDPNGVNGFGDDAVRCVQVEAPTTSSNEIIIEGFTLRGGRTKNRGDNPGYGGALQCSANGNDATYNTYLVGCRIVDCQAAVGSISVGGTLVRCQILDSDYLVPPSRAANGVYLYSGNVRFFSCLFSRLNRVNEGTHVTTNSSVYLPNGGVFVNCSFINNRASFWSHNTTDHRNTLVSTSRLPTDDGARHQNLFRDSTSAAALIAPTLGDYRVRRGSAAETAGDAGLLADAAAFPLPAAIDRFRDIDGNPIPQTGPICAGCCQTVATPAAGLLYAEDARLCFNDTTNTYSSHPAYVWPTAFPTNYRVRAVANLAGSGEEGYGVVQFQCAGTVRAASWRHDDAWVAPNPDVAARSLVTVTRSSKIVYAKPDADAAVADGSLAHPYPTLQAAYDKYACANMIIRALPGEYKAGGKPWGAYDQPVRLFLSTANQAGVRVVAMEGPEKTLLVGAPDPDTAGHGPKATMLLATNNGRTFVSGFTLTGGYTGTQTTDAIHFGKPIYTYSKDHLVLSDCVITNNHGAVQGVGCGSYERCLIADNHGSNAILFAARLDACVVADNHLSSKTGVICADTTGADNWKTLCLQSTIVGDGVHGVFSADYADTTILNSLFDRCGPSLPAAGTKVGNVFGGFFGSPSTEGNVYGDPMLTDGFRPFSQSPALTAAVPPAAQSLLVGATQTDFSGAPLRYAAGGRAYAGAVQTCTSGGVFIGRGSDGLAVDGADFGFTPAAAFTGATVAAAAGATRPLAGVIVNGVTNAFDAAHPVYVLSAGAGDVALVPYYSNDWYVDAVGGSDANWGYNAGNAFRTLARALSNANLMAGDRVVALPGTYCEGTVSNATTIVPARAYVPNDVTLVSCDGAATTFICGEASATPARYTGTAYGVEQFAGLGPDAVRGVFLEERGHVRGFTITDGHTFGFSENGAADHSTYRANGGNVAGSGTIEDCVIVGGKAFRGGGTYRTTAVRCIFDGNSALYGGGASSDALQYGCLSKNNACVGSASWGGFFYWRACENCTVLDSLGGASSSTGVLRNALLLGSMGAWDWIRADDQYATKDGHNFVNCAVLDGVGMMNNATYRQCFSAGTDCVLTNLEALVVDEAGRPVIGQNVAIDAGDRAVSPRLGDVDLSGVQRVYNGQIDCGALEADWRGRYAQDVSASHLAVRAASPEVVETEGRAVRLVDGATFSATFRSASPKTTPFRLWTTVAGGSLTVAVNGGEPFGPNDGGMFLLSLKNGDELTLAYSGTDHADIGMLSAAGGTTLIFR